MTDITSRIHWLSFTVHAPMDSAFIPYDLVFKDLFGPLQCLEHGGRSFRLIHKNAMEFKIYTDPVTNQGVYFHYEIPGSACDCITWERFYALYDLLESNYKNMFSFTRLDYAFDHVPFEPYQVKEAVLNKDLRSLAKRETLQIHESPLEKREGEGVGTSTVSLGSRTSERMIRVYDKRGFTRLEIEFKDKRADLVAKQLLALPEERLWFTVAQAHLLDYVDFKTDWWDAFVVANKRAGATISNPTEVSMGKLVTWIDKQVGPALSVAIDVLPEGVMKSIVNRGRRRRGDRYRLLLADAQPTTHFDGEGTREGRGTRQSVGGGL
jgi:DNA relaxase NicK